MRENAMLIDYGYCTGCHSCEITCRKEKGLSGDEWGIKVLDTGLEKFGTNWEWDYVPVLSGLCDLCADRIREGKKAACQLHCLASVIEVLPIEEVPKRLTDFSAGKVSVLIP